MTEIVPLFPEDKKESVLGVSQNQAYFGVRVDRNLRNITSSGYAYIVELLDNLFKTLIHTPEKNTDAGFYIRVEREMQKCSIFERKNIIELIDTYLPRPHMQQSQEKEFFMRIRNIAFIDIQKDRYPERYL